MKHFSDRSIRTKLILLLTGTATATLVFACAILWVYQYMHYRNMLRAQETATAQLISDASGAALMFRDFKVSNETLADLRADQRIEQACLYDNAGTLFVQFRATGTTLNCPPADAPQVRFTRGHLLLWRTIETQGQVVGKLLLQVSLREMYASLIRFAETILFALLLSIGFGCLLASMLQRLISRPILDLTRVALNVTRHGNYLLRARRTTSDEMGVLIDHFNTMMERIQEREEDLRKAHDNLEDKVRLRTQALENEILERKLIERDLESARVEAENASRAKSAFLANMSHELRTPLNAIIGYSEMLYEDASMDGNSDQVQDLEKILGSARHLLTLISDILDLSKIEAGKLKLEPVLTSSHAVLNEVIPTAEVLVKRNRNRLVINQEAADVLVDVDPLRLRQSLLNLVSNACKFTEDGTITLNAEMEQQDGRLFMIWTVADTGIGIPKEHLDRLFKTFSQVDDSNTRRFGGSGLGLAISQQLCQAMNGFISVESVAGEGSRFAIHIPVADPKEESLSAAA